MSDVGGVLCWEAVSGGVFGGLVSLNGWPVLRIAVFAVGRPPKWGSGGANREKGPFRAAKVGTRPQFHNELGRTGGGLMAAREAIRGCGLHDRSAWKDDFWKLKWWR